MHELWGIDLGGTKIEGVVLKGAEVLQRKRIPTEAEGGYEHILCRVSSLVDDLANAGGFERPSVIGIGTPGSIDPGSSLLKNSNTVCLNGKPLIADLERLTNVQLRCANDANCFALAEATLGAARGAETVFGVIMGTGVGGGVVVRDRVLNGKQGISGEWGHNVLEPDGQPCYCGKRGCVETVISGPALERHYASLSGLRRRLPEIVEQARRHNEPAALATLDRLCAKFGQALSVVVNIFDPDVVVLGGGVGRIDELLTHGRTELSKWVFNDRLETKVVKPELGDSAGVFGAALLCASSERSQSVSPIK